MIIKIKPLSVNDAWKGKRYKTDDYLYYERELLLKLRPADIPDGFLELSLIWGFSSAGSDIDNPLKPCLDILQKKYGFNDNRVKKLIVESVKVPKNDEFIYIDFNQYSKSNLLKIVLNYLGVDV